MKIKFWQIGVLALIAFTATKARKPSTDCVPDHTFTAGIEGPATDQYGNVYAVNYAEEGTIGIVRPDGSHGVYLKLPEGSVGNGIRFGKDGAMYVADYMQHNILKVDTASKEISVFVNEPRMNQPNDIAMAPNGTIYASDPDWKNGKGQLWMITPDGKIELLETDMGTTNGVEVSPDGKILYVGESNQRRIWEYQINDKGIPEKKRLLISFPDCGLDGMRCDVEGNLYVTRYDKGSVVILSPDGLMLDEIELKGTKPSNITFAGKDRTICYVTMADRGCFETFVALNPGRE